jgi:hypothetical protein
MLLLLLILVVLVVLVVVGLLVVVVVVLLVSDVSVLVLLLLAEQRAVVAGMWIRIRRAKEGINCLREEAWQDLKLNPKHRFQQESETRLLLLLLLLVSVLTKGLPNNANVETLLNSNSWHECTTMS